MPVTDKFLLTNTVKSYAAKSTATLMASMTTAFTDDKLVPVNIIQTSPFVGILADWIVIYDKRRL